MSTPRLERNVESLQRADHHREPWTLEEDDLLQGLWTGSDEDLAELAEILGRTIEACRERFYKVRRGEANTPISIRRTRTVTTTTTTTTTTDHVIEQPVCPICWLAHSGDCI